MVSSRKTYCLGGLVLSLGCNGLLGIEERPLQPNAGGVPSAGSAGESTAGMSGGNENNGGAPINASGRDAGGSSATAGSISDAAGGPSNGAGWGGGAGSPQEIGGMGGEGTVDPQVELDDAIKNLDGFHFENDCGYVDGHDLSTCIAGEVCYPNDSKLHVVKSTDIPIGGIAGHEYDLKLRLRGLLEPRDYPVACTRVTNPAGSNVAIVEGCDGYTNATSTYFNIFQLVVPSPAHRYYFNGVPTHPAHTTAVVNLEWTIRVTGQTTLAFTFDDLNGGQDRSCGGDVPGIKSAAAGGQFFQIDVEQTTLVQ